MNRSASFSRTAIFCLAFAGLLCFAPWTATDAQTRRTGGRTTGVKSPSMPPGYFSNTASITVTDRGAGMTAPNGTIASGPSTIAVSGLTGTVNGITVTLTGITTDRPRDLNIALVAPGGQTLMLMSDAGDLTPTSGVGLTFSDSGSALPTGAGSVIASGTFAPTDVFMMIAGNDRFPAPLGSLVAPSTPTGTATFASQFYGIDPNGTWKLYITDDAMGGGDTTIGGGWSMTFSVDASAALTATTVTSSNNPALPTDTITFTSTTTSGGSAVTAGTVLFKKNGTAITGCLAAPVNSSGQATCSLTLTESNYAVTATYSGTASFGTSNGALVQQVTSAMAVSGAQFCNNGGISIPENGAGSPGPSYVLTSGLFGTVNSVTVKLKGITTDRVPDLDLLLVSPGGAGAMQILSDAGAMGSVSAIDVDIADSGSGAFPSATPTTGATYKPTDNAMIAMNYYDATSPSTFGRPGPMGVSTIATAFGGVVANGYWRLHSASSGMGGTTSSLTGWCVDLTLNKFATVSQVASSTASAPLLSSVTLTASVSLPATIKGEDNMVPIGPAGSIEFFDGTTSLGTATISGGSASLTTSSLGIGTHTITSKYLGSNVGPGGGGYAISTSSPTTVEILAPTAAGVSVSGRVLSATGKPVGGAIVRMTDTNGNAVSATTNQFGFYTFTNVSAGQMFVFNVSAKGMAFSPQAVSVSDNLGELNFTGR